MFLPYLMVIGVKSVKTAVDKIPIDKMYFPPYFADKMAPGIWSTVYPRIKDKKNQIIRTTSKSIETYNTDNS